MEGENELTASEDDENRLIASELTRSLAAMKGGRDEALGQLAEVQVALHSMLRQEALRQRRRGREDRARWLEARAGSSLAVIAALETERQRLRIVVPDVPENGVLIHGRVRDPAGRGLPGLSVGLVDSKDRTIAQARQATTDESGYYAFVLSPSDRPDQQQRATLAVFSPKGRLLHREKQPLDLVPGGRHAVDVTLDPLELVRKAGKKPALRQKPRRAAGPSAGPSTGVKRKKHR